MDINSFRSDLATLDLKKVYRKYLLGNDVWYFRENYGDSSYNKYDEFKYYFSNKLDIHFNNIAILGSAKTGYSLNPENNLRAFNDNSDIDLVLVSNRFFEMFWDAYLLQLGSGVGINKYKFVSSAIFRKFITLEGFGLDNSAYCEWEKRTYGYQKDIQLLFKIKNAVNYRIYESWEAVELYYVNGLHKLKMKIESESVESENN